MEQTLFKEAWLQESPWARITIVAASGFVALCAHITIPLGFTPVPLSMAPFAVLLIGLLLPPQAAFSALALYLAEGAVGLPVFAPLGMSGIAQLLGPTGGYLLSYPFAAAVAGILYRRMRPGIFTALMGAASGSILILMTGAAWLAILTRAKLSIVFAQSVTPFLSGDLVKVIAAAGCARIFDSFRRAPRKPSED